MIYLPVLEIIIMESKGTELRGLIIIMESKSPELRGLFLNGMLDNYTSRHTKDVTCSKNKHIASPNHY